MKDSTHMLNILDSFRFTDGDGQRCIRLHQMMEVSAHCITISKRERSLSHLALALDTFEFNGEFHTQTGGLAMGSHVGPNYECRFVGYVEERMLSIYTGIKPDLQKRFM